MASSVPVWVWLPGEQDPVEAAELQVSAAGNRFAYLPAYRGLEKAVSLDPVGLRLSRRARGQVLLASDGLAGVLRDAKPSGYGADCLVAANGGAALTPLELLERGVPDGVGAIEVCQDIDRKLRWAPKGLEELGALAQALDAADPSSRAIRRLNDDMDTSAGGDRPKTTLEHDGRLGLAKMQDRNDRVAMPAREFVTMRLARASSPPAAAALSNCSAGGPCRWHNPLPSQVRGNHAWRRDPSGRAGFRLRSCPPDRRNNRSSADDPAARSVLYGPFLRAGCIGLRR